MNKVPLNPKIYHITHIDNLRSILAAGCINSDARRIGQGLANTNVGMTEIKERRLHLEVGCHPGTRVGEYVPFYFCPRSIMLYLIYRANHPSLSYRGGQRPIVHLEANLVTVVQWAQAGGRRWAFTKSNAGAYYTSFFKALDRLTEVDWSAVAAQDFRDESVKEHKQAEFLLFGEFPWHLVDRIGVTDATIAKQVKAILSEVGHQVSVSVQPQWYY